MSEPRVQCEATAAFTGRRCERREQTKGTGLCYVHRRGGRRLAPVPTGMLTYSQAETLIGVNSETIRRWAAVGWLRLERDGEPACFTVASLAEAHATARWKPRISFEDLDEVASHLRRSSLRQLLAQRMHPADRRGVESALGAVLVIAAVSEETR